jgi:signal transduction histidine kinase
MKQTRMDRLSARYLTALRIYIEQSPPAGLKAAHDLGRRAVTLELCTLDLAKIHGLALASLLPARSKPGGPNDPTARAAEFFTEANTAIEKTHRLATEAAAELDQLQTALAQRTHELADSNRELQQGISQRLEAVESLKASENKSARLLTEARGLQEHLQGLARRTISAREEEQRVMSLTLQDEIAQTLLGIHMRLRALDSELCASATNFKKEIATTQRLVQESVKTINRFAREFGVTYET